MTLLDGHDVTLRVAPGLAVWPGDPPVQVTRFAGHAAAGFQASAISLSLHAGTHVDGPCHVQPDAPGTEAWSFEALLGPVQVIDCQAEPAVSAECIAARLHPGAQRVLLQTGGGSALRLGFTGSGFATAAAASLLVERRVMLVGIDSLSIDAATAHDLPAHRILLGHGVVVLEGLDLSDVAAGWWDLTCLPLRVADADGAPSRVLLRRLAPAHVVPATSSR